MNTPLEQAVGYLRDHLENSFFVDECAQESYTEGMQTAIDMLEDKFLKTEAHYLYDIKENLQIKLGGVIVEIVNGIDKEDWGKSIENTHSKLIEYINKEYPDIKNM